MAEYIEREALVKRLLTISVVADDLYNLGINTGLDRAEKEVNNMPTAEVVPKSEVDDLKRYITLNEDIAIKCKQENGEQNEEYWKGKISAFRQTLAYIDAELKKKYAEQKNG